MNKGEAIKRLKAKMKKLCRGCNKSIDYCFCRGKGLIRDPEIEKLPICWVKWAFDLMIEELDGNA